MTRRLHALMLAPAMPNITGNGLAMRLAMYLKALTSIAEVDLLVAPMFGPTARQAEDWTRSTGAHVQVLDLRGAGDTQFGLLMRLSHPSTRAQAFAEFGRPSLAARLSTAAAGNVADLLPTRNYDLFHTARGYCAPFSLALADRISHSRKPVLTLDLDEDDSQVYRGLADVAGRRGRHQEQRWRALEAGAYQLLVDASAPTFQRVWVASSVDARRLRARRPNLKINVMPNAITVPKPIRRHFHGRTLLFVGSLGYEANQDAIEWLLGRIWPRVVAHASDIRLRIVGPHCPERLWRLGCQRGVEMLGWVPDLRRCYASATLTVAPIRVGGGTRIKLLESALHGVPIVATSLGAEGLGMKHGSQLWLADSAVGFSAAISYALARPDEQSRLARQARAHVARHFGWHIVVKRLSREFLKLV